MGKTPESQLAYSKGYAAGRRKRSRDDTAKLANWRREQFRQKTALVALEALLRPGMQWGQTIGGVHKPYDNMRDYSKAALHFADEILKHTWFSGDLFDRPEDEVMGG